MPTLPQLHEEALLLSRTYVALGLPARLLVHTTRRGGGLGRHEAEEEGGRRHVRRPTASHALGWVVGLTAAPRRSTAARGACPCERRRVKDDVTPLLTPLPNDLKRGSRGVLVRALPVRPQESAQLRVSVVVRRPGLLPLTRPSRPAPHGREDDESKRNPYDDEDDKPLFCQQRGPVRESPVRRWSRRLRHALTWAQFPVPGHN